MWVVIADDSQLYIGFRPLDANMRMTVTERIESIGFRPLDANMRMTVTERIESCLKA